MKHEAPTYFPDRVTDHRRLSALAAFDVLDTTAEAGFDDVVALACQLCETPIALVSFVDGERQWFKASVGFDLSATTLDQSVFAPTLVAPTLVAPRLLVIEDLSVDSRTRENTLVTGEPHLRFYAGVPLRTPDGIALGTICVIDTSPRPQGLSSAQASALQALARQVMSLLELRRALRDREDAVARQDALIDTQVRVDAASGDLPAILDAVVEGAMRAVPDAEGGAVLMRDGDDVCLHAARGGLARHQGMRLSLSGSLAGSCLQSGTPTLCMDSRLDVRVDHAAAERIAFRSCVLVPISRHGEIIGALKLQASRPGMFTDREMRLAQLFAGSATAGFAEASEAAALRSVGASDARYRAVFESAIDYGIIVMDLDGNITDWNEGATRILGWSSHEICGKPADVFFTPEDREAGIADVEMRSAMEVGRGNDERWHIRKDGSRFWANGEMMTLRDERGQAIGFLKILRDRTEQREAVARLQASEARLQTIINTVPVGIMFAEAPSGRIVGRNERMQEIAGTPSSGSKSIQDYGTWRSFHADGRRVEAYEYPLARVIGEGADKAFLQVHYERRDGSRIWLELAAAPVRDSHGTLSGAVVAVLDVDARKAAEAAQALMNGELSHRMKNLMSIVLSITHATMRNATDVVDARKVLTDRLITLGKAHDLLLTGQMAPAPLTNVVTSGIGVHADETGRFEIEGPAVVVGEGVALALAMMIHELTTNAAKYGALSNEEGRVAITWSLIDGEHGPDLRIAWRESGGPPEVEPSSRGFGSRLIERGVTGHVGGSVSIDYARTGVICVVQAPLARFQQGIEHRADGPSAAISPSAAM